MLSCYLISHWPRAESQLELGLAAGSVSLLHHCGEDSQALKLAEAVISQTEKVGETEAARLIAILGVNQISRAQGRELLLDFFGGLFARGGLLSDPANEVRDTLFILVSAQTGMTPLFDDEASKRVEEKITQGLKRRGDRSIGYNLLGFISSQERAAQLAQKVSAIELGLKEASDYDYAIFLAMFLCDHAPFNSQRALSFLGRFEQQVRKLDLDEEERSELYAEVLKGLDSRLYGVPYRNS